MPFAYYKRLKPAQKRIYEKSNSISSLKLPASEIFDPVLQAIQTNLAKGVREGTEDEVQRFMAYLCQTFKIPSVKVRVLEQRPSKNWGELHGLYQAHPQGRWFLITVWMRTAKRIQVVAFKTFLRTILHEFLHHLDYTYFKWGNSFHTEGFYQRETSLFKQLVRELP